MATRMACCRAALRHPRRPLRVRGPARHALQAARGLAGAWLGPGWQRTPRPRTGTARRRPRSTSVEHATMARAGFAGPTGSRWDGGLPRPSRHSHAGDSDGWGRPPAEWPGPQWAAGSAPSATGPAARRTRAQHPPPRPSGCSCNTAGAAATQQMQLLHSRCSCNTADAAATQQVQLQHSRCSCNTAGAAATQQVLLQHSRCCCNTTDAAATRPLGGA
jgi:hypothetical protein